MEAGEDGLKLEDLKERSGWPDARNMLRRLVGKSTAWAAVIQMAGRKGRGYRLLSE